MNFRIADTFTDSLARLTGQEQKAAKTTAFDLQMNPAHPGLKFHKLSGRDPNFWSVRVNRDIRLIVHKAGEDILLAYVDHHDDAYRWAERRRLEVHPETGAMQMVEVREVAAVEPTPAAPPPAEDIGEPVFGNLSRGDLMAFGVPADWVDPVREARDEDRLLAVLSHLPQEAAEVLLTLYSGGPAPIPARQEPKPADPYAHPDAERRFRLITSNEELERALDAPWDKWAVFLHPDQRRTVTRDFAGPARVSGSAGTGKTIVALHRAVHLARSGEGRVLLTTFSPLLAKALSERLRTLLGNEPNVMARIVVAPLREAVASLHEELIGPAHVASNEAIASLLRQAADASGSALPQRFLDAEWNDIVDAYRVDRLDAYRDVPRLGRKSRLGAKQREALWGVFETVRAELAARGLVTWPQVFANVTDHIRKTEAAPFRYVVVDEAQDLGVPEVRLLAALGSDRANALFFAGDLGQRIFRSPFSWKAQGIDVRGRSQTLKVNYRTSQQIRVHADRLLPSEIADIDQNAETRTGTISIFGGPSPDVHVFPTAADEVDAAGSWLKSRLGEGMQPRELALFVRSEAEIVRAQKVVASVGMAGSLIDGETDPSSGIAVGKMHDAKGLEFRGVAVLACDDDVLPHQERVDAVADENDLEEVYASERHLLYVACTRARDVLWVSGVKPASEFLDDLKAV